MSDLIERLRFSSAYESKEAADELERQAKEITSLVKAVADHVTVRSEQFAEIERQAKEIDLQQEVLAKIEQAYDEKLALKTKEIAELKAFRHQTLSNVAEVITRWAEEEDLPEAGFRILTPLKEGTKLYTEEQLTALRAVAKEMAGALEIEVQLSEQEGHFDTTSHVALSHWKELEKP